MGGSRNARGCHFDRVIMVATERLDGGSWRSRTGLCHLFKECRRNTTKLSAVLSHCASGKSGKAEKSLTRHQGALGSSLYPVGTRHMSVDMKAWWHKTNFLHLRTYQHFLLTGLAQHLASVKEEESLVTYSKNKCRHFSDNVLISHTFFVLIWGCRAFI